MNQAEKLGVQRVKRALNKELREIAWSNPELQSDDRLLRFLRSYGHDEQKTVTKMREMLKWRRIHGADKIRAEVRRCWTEDFWSMPCLQRRDFYREMYLFEPNHKELSNGDLASVEYTGRIHIRDFMHGISEHEIMTFWTYLMEWNMIKLAELSKKHNRIARMVQLKDLHGLSLWQATVGLLFMPKLVLQSHCVNCLIVPTDFLLVAIVSEGHEHLQEDQHHATPRLSGNSLAAGPDEPTWGLWHDMVNF